MEQPKKTTRVDFLREQFAQDYRKAIKKNKFLDLRSQEFATFLAKAVPQLNNNFSLNDEGTEPIYVDPAFFAFSVHMGIGIDNTTQFKSPEESIFNFFLEHDPTKNKEYLQWFMNMYRDVIRNRKPFAIRVHRLDPSLIQDGSYRDMLLGGTEYRFFEDLYKVTDALERYSFLKKTKAIKERQKDINRFETYEDFLMMVKPFMSAEEGSNSVHTLDHKELRALENQVEYEKGVPMAEETPRAELVYQDDYWVIVHTLNKEANIIFGKYTTWCTASATANRNAFNNYAKDGDLFVLIRKGRGSKREIDRDPMVRLQFHFETSQYMDANDKPIKIAEFLNNNLEIKAFFRDYVVKVALPKKGNDHKRHLEFLGNLGYGDELIKIYKEMQPPTIEINGFKLDPKILDELGEITSLEKLVLCDVGLTALPRSLTNLKKLKHLSCSGNPNLTEFPDWLKEMTQLTDIHFSECDIQNQPDLTGMVNLLQVTFDFNRKLTHFPKGIGDAKMLKRICLSHCDIREITSDIMGCQRLYMLDAHHNKKLRKIPLNITQLPNLCAICIDETLITDEELRQMEENKVGECDVIKYA